MNWSTLDFSWINSPFFKICVQGYIIVFAIVNFIYAVKSKNQPEKKNHPEYFINEFIVAIMFVVLFILYPYLFDQIVFDEYIKAQIYFHLWDSLTVHLLLWPIYLKISHKNYKKKHDNQIETFEDWKIRIQKSFKDDYKSDAKRKLMHLIPAGVIIGFFLVGILIEPFLIRFGWDSKSFALFFQVTVGIHFIWVMNIADHLRLKKFEICGKFIRNWLEDAVKPSELDTFTSASPMVLAFIPFVMSKAEPALLFSVVLIAATSDAMASIIGKRFGKTHLKNSQKTVEGYIAGAFTTYIIVILIHAIVPFPEANWLLVNAMALGAAIGFLLIDLYAKKVSDNFLNPIVTGSIIWILYAIFV